MRRGKKDITPIENENVKIISIVMLISVLTILLLILVFTCVKVSVFPQYDFPGSIDSWINAAASIAGGALAFGGVWWTIKFQNQSRIEDLERRDSEKLNERKILYKPILSCSIKTYSSQKGSYALTLLISNLGRGEAKNVVVSFVSNYPNDIAMFSPNKKISILPTNKSTNFQCFIFDSKSKMEFENDGVAYMDKLSPPKYKIFDLYFRIIYTDLFDDEYTYIFTVPVNNVKNGLLMDIVDEDYFSED